MENNDRLMFRVWDKIKKEFSENDFDGNYFIDLFGNLYFYSNGISMEEQNNKDYILLQSIGRRDKNGNLIFLGDIVKGYFNVDCVDDSIWLGLTDKEKEQGFKIFVVDSIHFGYEYPIPEDLEIIGNRFENSELLKEDK